MAVLKKGTTASIANVAQTKSNAGYTATGGYLYVIAGHALGHTRSAQKYNTSANSWTAIADLAYSRYDLACVAIHGKVYAFGGHDGSGNYFNYNEEYDPMTNSWVTKSPMPYGSEDHGAVSVDSKAFVIGGHNASGYLDHVQKYDPATDTWVVRKPMPTKRNSFGIATDGRYIYTVGGLRSGAILNEFARYDTINDTWEALPDMPTKRRHCRCAWVEGVLYVIGGYFDESTNINQESTDVIEAYVPEENKWYRGFTKLITPRDRFAIGVVLNKVYCATGWSSGWYTSTAEVFNPLAGNNLFLPMGDITLPNPNPIDKDNIDFIRRQVNTFRTNNGLPIKEWTDPNIIEKKTRVEAVHWNEIQEAITEVYDTIGIAYQGSEVENELRSPIMPRYRKDLIIGLGSRLSTIIKGLKNSN